jgi:uncharacterized protein YjlB
MGLRVTREGLASKSGKGNRRICYVASHFRRWSSQLNHDHYYFVEHEVLVGKAAAEVAGIQIDGKNKGITVIQNARKSFCSDTPSIGGAST